MAEKLPVIIDNRSGNTVLKALQQIDVATAIETESTLVDQPKAVELEYRVIAVNKAGVGSPSNTVMVVL